MRNDRLQDIEREARLSAPQRVALSVMRGINVGLFNELYDNTLMDIMEGIPQDHLKYGVLYLATFHARVSSPSGNFEAVKKEACRNILSVRNRQSAILKPFFMAKWAGRDDLAKLRVGEKWNGSPEEFFSHKLQAPLEDVEEVWRILNEFGVIEPVWDDGEERCHYELNQTVFDAFKDGVDWEGDTSRCLSHAKMIFDLASQNS